MSKDKEHTHSVLRRSVVNAQYRAVTWLAVGLAFLVFAMVNYLSYRHYIRSDISQNDYFKLSDKTIQLLDTVTNRLDVIAFFKPGNKIYTDLEILLKEYEYRNPLIHVRWIDPDRDIADADALVKRYGVEEEDVVIFDNDGRTVFVSGNKLTEYDTTPLKQKKLPILTAFKGEQAFSSAIQSITQKQRPVVYFLQGHGEGNPEITDSRTGFSKIAQAIERDNITIRRLTLGLEKTIPKDCSVLILAGPRHSYSLAELDIVRDYLEKTGRLMLLTDSYSDSGLNSIFEDWGVQLHRDLVVDPQRTLTGRGDLYLAEFFPHPITTPLKNITAVMYLPTSLIPVPAGHNQSESADRPHVSVLAASSEAGWAETDLDSMQASFNPDEDVAGPIPVAVAIEKGPVPGIDVSIRPTRIVVFGDADFVSNKGLISGNADLFMSALNWLLDRQELMAIAPKAVETTRLMITGSELNIITGLVILGLPALIALIGGLVWLRRRK